MDKIKIKKDNNMNDNEIGATLCDNCDQVVYESEFNLINFSCFLGNRDYDVVCNKCNEEITNKKGQ